VGDHDQRSPESEAGCAVRLSRYGWEAAGGAIVLVLLVTIVTLELHQNPAAQQDRKARRQQIAGQLRLALASATEAEKSAVLATTDVESEQFAAQARAASVEAEQKRAELAGLVDGIAREKELLAQFSQTFSKYKQIDEELLALAVQNTNLKASALLFGPLAEASSELSAALSRLISASAKSSAPNARNVMQLAASAQAGAFRIQVLLPPHIAEESDKKMDELEGRMRQADETVRAALHALNAAVPQGGRADAEAAAASYARFTSLKEQILKLSRANTNVRSLALSLNEKRSVTISCQATLAALETAIAEEPIDGRSNKPFKPR
jgi:Four helix bundle sensory module for signal transduction